MRIAKSIYIFLLCSLFSTVVACSLDQSPQEAVNALVDSLGEADADSSEVFGKVSLTDASLGDIRDHADFCSHNEKKLCVRICHRPPGNPRNAKGMELPLQAIAAHLRHGAGKQMRKDHLGDCDQDVGSEEDGHPNLEPPSLPQDPPLDPEIPAWCEGIMDIDSDCDGFNDETGEPLL